MLEAGGLHERGQTELGGAGKRERNVATSTWPWKHQSTTVVFTFLAKRPLIMPGLAGLGTGPRRGRAWGNIT